MASGALSPARMGRHLLLSHQRHQVLGKGSDTFRSSAVLFPIGFTTAGVVAMATAAVDAALAVAAVLLKLLLLLRLSCLCCCSCY